MNMDEKKAQLEQMNHDWVVGVSLNGLKHESRWSMDELLRCL